MRQGTRCVVFAAIVSLALLVVVGDLGERGGAAEHRAVGSVVPSWRVGADWRDETWRWVTIAYREDEPRERGGFGALRASDVTTPGLPATLVSMRLMVLLAERVPHAAEKGVWIRSLRGANGVYGDPEGFLDDLRSTQEAVTSLELLRVPVEEPERTVAYVRSLRSPDGTFSAGGDELVDTVLCVEILIGLGSDSSLALARETVPALKASVDSYLGSTAGEAVMPTSILGAMWSLARIDPAALSDEACERVRTSLEASFDDGRTSLTVVALQAAAEIDALTGRVVDAELRRRMVGYAESELVPYLSLVDSKSYPAGAFSMVEFYCALYVVRYLGVEWPTTGLRSFLELYETERGWVPQIDTGPTLQHTAYGLAVADAVGFRGYSAVHVATFLKEGLELEAAADVPNLGQVAFALEGLIRMGAAPPNDVLDAMRPRVMSQGAAARGSDSAYRFCRVVALARWELADDIKTHLLAVVRQDRAGGKLEPYRWAVIQSVVGQDVLSRDELTTMTLGLWRRGGFVEGPLFYEPSVLGARQAVETLNMVGRADAVDSRALEDFLWACKEKQGFANTPAADVGTAAYAPVTATLESTSEAIAALEMLGVWPERFQNLIALPFLDSCLELDGGHRFP